MRLPGEAANSDQGALCITDDALALQQWRERVDGQTPKECILGFRERFSDNFLIVVPFYDA